MARPQNTKTNAADSAPGVDDGKLRPRGANINSRPGGRGLAWAIVGVSLVILVLAFVFQEQPRDRNGATTGPPAAAEQQPTAGMQGPAQLPQPQ